MTESVGFQTERRQHQFYLVQRLEMRTTPNADRGFDGFFAMDYMGSAEYEFSTPSDSLKSMRSKPLDLRRCDIDGTPVYFVGDPSTIEAKVDDLEAWLTAPRSKESSYFPEALTHTMADYQDRINAWWSFDDDLAWAMDREIAEQLLLAFQTRAKK